MQEELSKVTTQEEFELFMKKFGPGVKPTQKYVNAAPFSEVLEEYELIKKKQSKLTKSQRDAVIYRVENETV